MATNGRGYAIEDTRLPQTDGYLRDKDVRTLHVHSMFMRESIAKAEQDLVRGNI